MTTKQFSIAMFGIVIAGLIGGMISALIFSPHLVHAEKDQIEKVIMAEQFILVGAEGQGHATLAMLKNEPILSFSDKNNKPRIFLGITGDESPLLEISDAAQVAATKVATQGVVVIDTNKKVRANLSLLGDGSPRLALADKAGSNKTALLSSGLSFIDPDNEDSGSILTSSWLIFHENAEPRAKIGESPGHSGSFIMLTGSNPKIQITGKNNKTIWSAP